MWSVKCYKKGFDDVYPNFKNYRVIDFSFFLWVLVGKVLLGLVCSQLCYAKQRN